MTRTIHLAFAWLACFAVFLTLDAIWLGAVSGSLYTDVLGALMPNGFRIVPAALFYPLFVTGIVIFVLPLARVRLTPWAAVPYGALFGVCGYGTYDLTNQAVLAVWTTRLTITDMAWGAVVTATSSLAGAWVDQRWPAAPETRSGSRR